MFFFSRRCSARSATREQTLLRQGEKIRSPRRSYDLCSQLVEHREYHQSPKRRRTSPPSHCHAPRIDTSQGLSNSFSESPPAPRSSGEKSLLRQRKRSRSPRRGYDLRSQFVEYKEYAPSARRRRTTSPPSYDHAPNDNATPGTSNSSSQNPAPSATREQTLLRQRERSRSPQRGYDPHSWLVEYTEYHHSARRRRSISVALQMQLREILRVLWWRHGQFASLDERGAQHLYHGKSERRRRRKIQEAPQVTPTLNKLHKKHQQPTLSLLPVLPVVTKSSEGASRDWDSSASWPTCPQDHRGRALISLLLWGSPCKNNTHLEPTGREAKARIKSSCWPCTSH